MKNYLVFSLLCLLMCSKAIAQKKNLAPTPPMGFMTWNYMGENINENNLKEVVDAMVASGLTKAGYNYLFIDDGWQGGRNERNEIIPDAKKFPSGIKALCDYVHSKGMKLGIYSDAAQLTCAGYTASLGFENQDAKTFAKWGVDYLKYDYCHAPSDWQTAIARYSTMAKALQTSGKNIAFGICEWGERSPWLWAAHAGGHLWRTTPDVRDKWSCNKTYKTLVELGSYGAGIYDIYDATVDYGVYASPNQWNDPDMLVVGLYHTGEASNGLGGVGCNDIEYQSQMSLWAMMAAPLMITCNVSSMNEATQKILMNKDILAIDQDSLGKPAARVFKSNSYDVLLRELSNGDKALALLNVTNTTNKVTINLRALGLDVYKTMFNVWTGNFEKIAEQKTFELQPHQTLVFRIKK